jgi:tRNA G18 (ribose-2'-O)-methylase SpoU
MPAITFVADLTDERLAQYRDVKDRRLGEASGKFIAESELCVRRLLASGHEVDSLLVTGPRLASLEPTLAALPPRLAGLPVYVVPQHVLDGVAGLHVHRGCLAVGRRPVGVGVPAGASRVLVLEELVDVDNVGALVRNGAALGADALVLSPGCADAYYRKAIRTSAGAVFDLPIIRARAWPDDLLALRERHGLPLVGAVLDDGAIPLDRFAPPPTFALVLGAEGPGLAAPTKRLCDALVTIPMARADSLNVATAGAILLYQLGRLAHSRAMP